MGSVVANTFTEAPADQNVTYREPGAAAFGAVTERDWNVLDFVFCEASTMSGVSDLRSVRTATLASNHYLVIVPLLRHAAPVGRIGGPFTKKTKPGDSLRRSAQAKPELRMTTRTCRGSGAHAKKLYIMRRPAFQRGNARATRHG